jgi:hypothetical protein
MIMFNLLLKRRDGQYFITIATVSKNIAVAAISENIAVTTVLENVVVAPNSEIPPWHEIIAPRPAPSTPSPRRGPPCTLCHHHL